MEDNDHFFETQAGEWVGKAQEDELSAKSILKHRDGSPGTVCFLSHQMGEKYLKAFLVSRVRKYQKIHFLDALVKDCAKIDSSFREISKLAIFLNAFYIPSRYPADYPDFFWEDAEEAYKAAEEIKNFVMNKIKL